MGEPITPTCVKLIPPSCLWDLEAKDGGKMSSVALPAPARAVFLVRERELPYFTHTSQGSESEHGAIDSADQFPSCREPGP